MNPILKYIKNWSAYSKIVGTDTLKGLPKVEALVLDLVNTDKIPGIAITVLHKGNVLIQKGYGYASLEDKTPVNPVKTVFRIASVSKNIAATALADMVQKGIIDLDASFYTYVPEYPKKEWDFTIRQLASHTAGIRGYQGKEYGFNKPFSIAEGISIFKDDPLLFKPGTNYSYNSYDWVLISLAMERASGIPFENYVRENVLQPLQLHKTFAPANPKETRKVSEKQQDLAVCYSKNRLGFREAIPVNNYYKLAGGGFLATTADIAKFGQAVLDKKVCGNEALKPFLTSEYINGEKTYYGLGWQVSEDKKGRPYVGHVGNGVGGYANFFVYPEQELVVCMLINCTDPKVQAELDEVVEGVHEAVNSTENR